MERRGPAHSGPFGLACSSCFTAKTRCIARADGKGCQRCARLQKACRPSDALRTRAIEKKQGSTVRIAELESRVQHLISQLQSHNVLGGDAMQQQTGDTQWPSEPTSATISGMVTDWVQGQGYADAEDSDNDDVAAPPEPLPEISVAEADARLVMFRSRMLQHFAILHLPAQLAPHQLRHTRPFLFQAIVCVASPSTMEKVARGRALSRAILEATSLGHKGQSSVNRTDCLLALLTYISWGWDQTLSPGILPQLIAQANTLASALRLDDQTQPDARIIRLFTPEHGSVSPENTPTTKKEFLERQRAILGCFVLSSIASAMYGQVDTLRWTSQMEDGLAALSVDRDCPTDATLAAQVRLQLLAQKAVQAQQQQEFEQGQAASTETSNLTALVALTTLHQQLQGLQTSLASRSLPQHSLVTAHAQATDLAISEATAAVYSAVPIMVSQFSRMTGTTAFLSTSNSTTTNGDGTASSVRERTQCLWRSVRAAHACATTLLAPPPSDSDSNLNFRTISLVQWAQLARSVAALDRLAGSGTTPSSTTTAVPVPSPFIASSSSPTGAPDEPGWARERPAARALANLPALLGRVADGLEQAAAGEAGVCGRSAVFVRMARRMRQFGGGLEDVDAVGRGEAMERVGSGRRGAVMGVGVRRDYGGDEEEEGEGDVWPLNPAVRDSMEEG